MYRTSVSTVKILFMSLELLSFKLLIIKHNYGLIHHGRKKIRRKQKKLTYI